MKPAQRDPGRPGKRKICFWKVVQENQADMGEMATDLLFEKPVAQLKSFTGVVCKKVKKMVELGCREPFTQTD